MTSYRRTRSAILEGAKSLIAAQGLQRANMVDIADTAQVSRATLYNHFRDKSSVMRALLESEVDRLLQIADGDLSAEEVLAFISKEISTDSAIATLRRTDPGILTQLLISFEDPLWIQIRVALDTLLGDMAISAIVQRWLAAQVMQPLTGAENREQAHVIVQMLT
ncbi:MAG: helix-turn-helix transcriptional regulator [Actinobacteria bacterium]|nr:helix-turn-helix transcriptional regulator [Actinomycetota bacterium]